MTSGSETGRFTVRRLRSAVFLWISSIRRSDVLAAAAVAVLSFGLGAYLLARAQAPAHLAFAQRAQLLQAAITERLSLPQEDLATLRSFFETSGRVTRRQFQSMTIPMLSRHRLVYALEWLPLVRGSERYFHEAEARAAGLSTYRIWETGPDGKPLPAAARAVYAPIQYMEPPSALALGFDIASSPERWRNAEAARDSGMIVASSPFVLLEDAGRPDPSPSIALYAAVYLDGDPGTEEARRASVSGFAMAIFRVAPLAQAAAAVVDASGLAFSLSDAGVRGAPMVERPRRLSTIPRRSGFRLDFPVRCANRVWTLDVVPLPGAFLPSRRTAVTVATIGMLAALLGLLALTSLRTISRLRRQAEKVGPYRLVARLGNGAMGIVWEARHALLRRPTAIKLLAPGTEGEKSLARFEREVQLTAGLTHPSTIAIYDYGRTPDGVFYYAMELLRGLNLQQLVDFGGPLPAGRVVHLLRQACGALSEAHAAGLIHRDIKPANLMICLYGGIPDFLKILDFGLVKDVGAVEEAPGAEAPDGGDAGLSQDGSLLGTPLYMAPEGMSDPTKVDARADLFGLGAVGYFLLTGGSPFPGRTAIEIFKRERHGPPAPLSGAAPHPVSPALEDAIGRCLAFDREKRPESVEAFGAMLEACAAASPWNGQEARAWWRDRGPAALAAARAQREEAAQVMFLSSDNRFRG